MVDISRLTRPYSLKDKTGSYHVNLALRRVWGAKGRLTEKMIGRGEEMNPSTLALKLSGRATWCTLLFVLAVFFGGCAHDEPAPTPAYYVSAFDRVWNSALGAAEDAGVGITSSDRSTGIIQGFTGSTDVTISVWTQADGSIRVEFTTRGPDGGEDADVNERLTYFYNRRRGR